MAAELLRNNGHPKVIQPVAINMGVAYVRGVRVNFGNARMVYDKFHVILNVMEACHGVRRVEIRADAGKRTCWSGHGGCGSKTG